MRRKAANDGSNATFQSNSALGKNFGLELRNRRYKIGLFTAPGLTCDVSGRPGWLGQGSKLWLSTRIFVNRTDHRANITGAPKVRLRCLERITSHSGKPRAWNLRSLRTFRLAGVVPRESLLRRWRSRAVDGSKSTLLLTPESRRDSQGNPFG